MNDASRTYSTEVGGLMVDVNPLTWKVVTPFDVKVPVTLTVCEVTLVQTPLKFATCEQLKDPVTTKYCGIDTCMYPGAWNAGWKLTVNVVAVSSCPGVYDPETCLKLDSTVLLNLLEVLPSAYL